MVKETGDGSEETGDGSEETQNRPLSPYGIVDRTAASTGDTLNPLCSRWHGTRTTGHLMLLRRITKPFSGISILRIRAWFWGMAAGRRL